MKRIGFLKAIWQGKGTDYRNTPFLQVYSFHAVERDVKVRSSLRAVVAGRSSVYCPECQE